MTPVQEINNSDCLIKFVEIGAGTPIASAFFNEPNASKTVYEVRSPYNNARELYGIPEDMRMVSKEALVQIVQNLGKSASCKYVVLDSFQIPSNNQIISHGWIGILSVSKFVLFHITLPNNFTRSVCISEIGRIGVSLIHSEIFGNTLDKYENLYIDNILEYDGEKYVQNVDLLLTQKCEDNIILFKDGNVVRFEDEYRGQNILVYKGSFNPIHEGHIGLIEKAKKEYDGKPLFLISSNTYQKGIADNLVERISKINSAGYVVGIMNNGFYWDNLNFLFERTFGKNEIVACLGLDSMSRLVDCYKNHEWSRKELSWYVGMPENQFMEEMFSKFRFAVFDRNQGDRECLKWANVRVDFHEFEMNISSSEIRGVK